jgi:hypothetical protein
MTENASRELLARIGEARIADSATLQRLNYKAVATGLAMPYEVFHGLDSGAEHLGVVEGVWGGRDLWVVWAVAGGDSGRTFGSIAVSVPDVDALTPAEVSDEEAQRFRNVFQEAGRRAATAGQAKDVLRERIRASVRGDRRRHNG